MSQLFLAFAAMTAEVTGRRKLAELVSHHVLSDKHLLVNLAVMHHKGMANKLRNYRAGSGPSGNGLLNAGVVLLVDLRVKLRVDVRTFFD